MATNSLICILRGKNTNSIKTTICSSLIILIFLIGFFGCKNSNDCRAYTIKKISKDLGIGIPKKYTIIKDTISYQGQDYRIDLILEFDESASQNLEREIKCTKYFNLKQEFYGEWSEKNPTFYWEVRDYLKTKHLTGLWKFNENNCYTFFEPGLSDIPNASILFDEGYCISATFNKIEKKLYFKYLKI